MTTPTYIKSHMAGNENYLININLFLIFYLLEYVYVFAVYILNSYYSAYTFVFSYNYIGKRRYLLPPQFKWTRYVFRLRRTTRCHHTQPAHPRINYWQFQKATISRGVTPMRIIQLLWICVRYAAVIWHNYSYIY